MVNASNNRGPIDGPNGLKRVRVEGVSRLVYAAPDGLHPLDGSLAELLAAGADALARAVSSARAGEPLDSALEAETLVPIDDQEVWASGVTYQRSRAARMSESVSSDVYERVYDAERPELFFKSPAWRVTPPGRALRIRGDSSWDVAEPELALVTSAQGEIVGYLVADDMSSREIEGANPLYLPQAKIYDDALALSDTIVLASELERDVTDVTITLRIERDGVEIFTDEVSTATIRRRFEELVEYLYRELSHPSGAVLLTGTGIVPPDQITLAHGDEVEIEIEGVGVLRHGVYRADRVALSANGATSQSLG